MPEIERENEGTLERGCQTKIQGYMSFWCENRGEGRAYTRGYNGSNTYSLHPSQNIECDDVFVRSIKLFHY